MSYKPNKLILILIVLYNNLFLYQLSDVETQRKSAETIIKHVTILYKIELQKPCNIIALN